MSNSFDGKNLCKHDNRYIDAAYNVTSFFPTYGGDWDS